MTDKLMYILNDYAQNFLFCRLQLEVEMFGHSNNKTNIQNLADE